MTSLQHTIVHALLGFGPATVKQIATLANCGPVQTQLEVYTLLKMGEIRQHKTGHYYHPQQPTTPRPELRRSKQGATGSVPMVGGGTSPKITSFVTPEAERLLRAAADSGDAAPALCKSADVQYEVVCKCRERKWIKLNKSGAYTLTRAGRKLLAEL